MTMRFIRFEALALLFVAVCGPLVQAGKYNVAGNVLLNTLLIQTPLGKGTGFTIDVDGRQYLVTARHMVRGMGPEGTIEVASFDNGNKVMFTPYRMKIFSCEGSIDVAVLIPPVRLTEGDTMQPTDLVMGQDAYFIGFPFGMYSAGKINPPGVTRPVGFVKQGLVSAVQYQSDGDADLILLDGYNVFGFSGGPVTYWEPPNHSYVIGVISGFRPTYGDLLVPKEIRQEDVKPEDLGTGRIIEKSGHVYRLEEPKVNGKKTGEVVMMNTGIVHSYSIQAAIKLIRLHAIGPVIAGDAKSE